MLTILSTVIFVQLGTSGYSQLLASWGERSGFASLGMEIHPAQPPTALPDFLSLLAAGVKLATDQPRQHLVTSQGDRRRCSARGGKEQAFPAPAA